MDLGLAGRRVLITGGSQGIGYAVAKGFLDEGCRVVIAARDASRQSRLTSRSAAPPRRWPMPIRRLISW